MFLCNDCRDKFTVRPGTVMERSHMSEARLAHYCAEFDCCYSTRDMSDAEGATLIHKGTKASASPIGGLVKARTPKQKAKRLLRLSKRRD